MGLRETLNEKPAVTTAATALILLISIVVIAYQLIGTPQNRPLAYYTIDDGQTTFSDDFTKIPPFIHDGHPAIRAMVFTCDGGKTHFVGWLERYTPLAKRKLEGDRTPGTTADLNVADIESTGKQVKLPGAPESEWTLATNSDKYTRITTPKCPDGKTEGLTQLLP